MKREHFLTPTKTHMRSFITTPEGAEVANVHKDTGVIYYDMYKIARLPDVNGVAVYRCEVPNVTAYTVHDGRYPACTCQANTRQRGVFCKHIIMVQAWVGSTCQVKPETPKVKHDFTRAEAEFA